MTGKQTSELDLLNVLISEVKDNSCCVDRSIAMSPVMVHVLVCWLFTVPCNQDYSPVLILQLPIIFRAAAAPGTDQIKVGI